MLAWGVFSDDPANDGEDRSLLSSFWLTADMVPNFVDYRRSEHFWNKGYTGVQKLRKNGIKGTQVLQPGGGGKKATKDIY